jgi:gamma-glutamyltranspeptidase/glutathione hydrolase
MRVNGILFFLLIFSIPIHLFAQDEIGNRGSGKNGVIAAGKTEAVEAGIRMFEDDGNAVDAAVASLLVLSVKHIGAFCIGGEVPLIIYDAEKDEVKVLSGQGAAPMDTSAIAWYFRNGIPGSNIRSAAVPAVIDLCVTALQLYGTMSFEQVSKPLLYILDNGGPNYYRDTGSGRWVDGISGKKVDKKVFKKAGEGRSWYYELASTIGRLVDAERMLQGTREQKLQAVADRFYRGDIANELVAWYIERGGFLRKKDLDNHKTHVEDPVEITYRGHTIYKCDTWTQGPYLSQTLRLIEGYDLNKMGFLSPDYIHVVTEAMKLALADRDEYYGDPLFADVPLQILLSDEYTDLRRSLIDMDKASQELRPGDPYKMKALLEGGGRTFPNEGGTTTCVTADKWGNVVVTTPSGLGSSAGSGGRTGITHGARLIINNNWPGHPNAIGPGKRPRTSLTPTLVMKEGKPFLAISVAGGDMQDQAALQIILDVIDFGMDIDQAMKAARFSTQHFIGSFGQDPPRLGSLRLHNSIGEDVQNILKKRGHKVKMTRSNIGGIAMLYIDQSTGTVYGAGAAAKGID